MVIGANSRKLADCNNFFCKGRRITEPEQIEENLLKFTIEIMQEAQADSFVSLKIFVLVSMQIWVKFCYNSQDTEWLEVSGHLRTEYSEESVSYIMEATNLSSFDSSLYPYLGGECYYKGPVVVLRVQEANGAVKSINAKRMRLADFRCKFDVLALRGRVKELTDIHEASNLVVEARLMPSTNREEKPPFFSLKSCSHI